MPRQSSPYSLSFVQPRGLRFCLPSCAWVTAFGLFACQKGPHTLEAMPVHCTRTALPDWRREPFSRGPRTPLVVLLVPGREKDPQPWQSRQRLGEADRPGPPNSSQELFRMAVLNPTALLHKEYELQQLQCQLYCCAETSVVARAQPLIRHSLRPLCLRAFFSPPVPSIEGHEGGRTSLRGCAGGVAILTSLPARPSVQPLDPALSATTRIVEAFVRIAGFEVRVLTLYGLPRNRPDHQECNALLLGAALQRTQLSSAPAIVAGDFNQDLSTLEAYQAFEDMGYVSAADWHLRAKGVPLPPTCRGSTTHDGAIFHPALAAYLQDVHVDTSHLFDSHSPVVCTFRAMPANPTIRVWPLPVSYTHLRAHET